MPRRSPGPSWWSLKFTGSPRLCPPLSPCLLPLLPAHTQPQPPRGRPLKWEPSPRLACVPPTILPAPPPHTKRFLEGWLLPHRMEGTLGVLSRQISPDSSIPPIHLPGVTLGCSAPGHMDSPDPQRALKTQSSLWPDPEIPQSGCFCGRGQTLTQHLQSQEAEPPTLHTLGVPERQQRPPTPTRVTELKGLSKATSVPKACHPLFHF